MISYDKLGTRLEMLLDLLLSEGTGTNAQDWAKPHHVCTLTGVPTWQNLDNGLPYLDFDPNNPDYILSLQAATTDLDFVAGAFTLLAWLRPDALGNRNIFTRGVHNTDGWYFYLDGTGAMQLVTSQAGAFQASAGGAGDIAIGTWVLVGATRSGASARIYTNGRDTTATPAAHVNPVTANRNLYIGVNNLAAAAWYDGDLWRPRILGRDLTAAEMLTVFECERHFFGV